MNYSKQREALKKVLKSTRSHPTAEWLYTELRKEYPNTSRGTVYRNLSRLSETGEVLRLSVGDSSEHYDGFTHPHDHFVCSVCGAILDVDVPLPDEVNEYVYKSIGADVEKRSLIFYGKCRNCIENEKSSHNKL